MKRIITLLFIAGALLVNTYAQKYVGGDISMLPKYEEHGTIYKDHDGNNIEDMLEFLRLQGWNSMRVRLFVDPANATDTEKGEGVCQDLDYVKALGKRIKEKGMAFVLDFHYSDTWADPAKQWTPASWVSLSDNDLYTKIYEYTKSVLQELKAAGATPDFIQTGNEISYGMLWGENGSSSLKKCYTSNSANWSRFTTLLKKAGEACREECPDAKIIIHTERAAQTSVLKAFYDNMASYGVEYDIIGLSYYPYYHGDLNTLETAINTLETNFQGKDIMIVETGYSSHWSMGGTFDYSGTYPYSEEGQKNFTEDLIDMLNNHGSVKGLYWWWPEANEYGLDWSTNRVTDNWYNASLFDNETGKATLALSSLRTFLGDLDGIANTTVSKEESNDDRWLTIDGRQVSYPSAKGLYIHKGKVTVF